MYSQNNEESIILNFFGNKVATFADFGSNDGQILSNTLALAEKGWSGILVEPSEEAFKRLVETYKNNELVNQFDDNIICLRNCAVTGTYDGLIELFESSEHIGKGDVSLLSTTIESETERWKGTNTIFTPTTVKAKPVNKILLGSDFETIDFFSIDVEGKELEIIAEINFDKYQTKMICVEWNSKAKEKYDEIILPFGFHLLHQNAENLIYVR